MASRMFSTKPLSEPVLAYCELDPCEDISVKFESNTTTFIQDNLLENVCKIAAFFS